MSTCYKCGRELAGNQVECDPVCGDACPLTEEQIDQAVQDYNVNTVPIDWSKVVTLEDLKEIMRTMMFDDRIHRDSLAYQQLKRFLKSEPDQPS